jgi:hypothetical protein
LNGVPSRVVEAVTHLVADDPVVDGVVAFREKEGQLQGV